MNDLPLASVFGYQRRSGAKGIDEGLWMNVRKQVWESGDYGRFSVSTADCTRTAIEVKLPWVL